MLKIMKPYALFAILLLSVGMFSGAWAQEKKGCAGMKPDSINPVKKAARAVVGIWNPALYRASITEIYHGFKGPIAISGAGVVLDKSEDRVLIITADLPQTPYALEFLEDRSWRDMPIDRLLRERTARIEEVKEMGGGLVSISIKTNDIPLFQKVKAIQIGDQASIAEGSNVFMVVNYLGKAELCIWGVLKDGHFVEETGLSKSFGVPGSPVFNDQGELVGVFRKDGSVLFIASRVAEENALAKLYP